MKIPVKIILTYLGVLMLVFLIVNTVGMEQLEKDMLQKMRLEYFSKAQKVADEYVTNAFEGNMSADKATEELIMISQLIEARIWIVNSKHMLAADSMGRAGIFVNGLFENDDETFREDVMIKGVIPEPSLVVSVPIIYDYSARGYVCLIVPMQQARTRALPYMDIANIALLVISIIVALGYLIIYLITASPVRKLRKAALEYAKGNYSYEMKMHRSDEFSELRDAIKYMVDRIRNVDDYQKKFIANISHDFRSPLTSIKGYAEAMKDGTIPVEAQGKYLDIILFETERLTKLTTNLLDLSRIDNQGLLLDITTFDINRVIKQTADAFEGICSQKKVVIRLTFAEWETNVEADVGRIQQVLYNLTDNAIKFSHDGGVVEIETVEKGSKVLVRVRDHGRGIPKDKLKKIWDRFYKIDTSRGKDKKGTGLGLSIVKEIITAHGENINVISTEGVGTEFTFTLPFAGE